MADLAPRLDSLTGILRCGSILRPAQKASFDNPSWETATLKVLILRLSPLRDVDRSTSHLALYGLARDAAGSGAFLDLAFMPSRVDRDLLEEAALPPIFGVASRRSVDDFDVLLVSVAYAMELPNLPRILADLGFPLRSSERRAQGGYPLIVAGGSNALASQAWIFGDGDSFVDALFFGEAEEGGAALIRALAAVVTGESDGLGRLGAADHPSLWVAGSPLDGSVRVRTARRTAGPAISAPYPLLNTEEAGTARLSISAGCPAFCTFCFEGWERKPYREVPMEALLDQARALKASSGAHTLELDSFNFNAHSSIVPLIQGLNGIFDRVSLMSQRADLLAGVHGLLRLEFAAEKRSYTVGVEGISDKMRSYYAKGLSRRVVMEVLEKLFREKAREIKLFYILSGRETQADLQEFHLFCKDLKELRRDRGPSVRVVFSFGYLVRMPFTPLRYEALTLDRDLFRGIEGETKKSVETHGFEFRLAADWEEYLADQLLVSGSYALAEGLERACKRGAAFDLRLEGPLLEELMAALERAGELKSDETGRLSGPLVDEKDQGYPFALSFVDTPVSSEVLYRRITVAREGKEEDPCFSPFTKAPSQARCSTCGACRSAEERRVLLEQGIVDDRRGEVAEAVQALIRGKRRARPRWALIRLPEHWDGAVEELRNALLLRGALGERSGQEQGIVDRLMRVQEALFSEKTEGPTLPAGWTGMALIALYGLGGEDETGIPRLSDADYGLALTSLKMATGGPVWALDHYDPKEGADAVLDLELRMEGYAEKEALEKTRAWLGAQKLPYTEQKSGERRNFIISPKHAKKRAVMAATLHHDDLSNLWMLVVRGGRRMDLALLKSARSGSSPRIRVHSIQAPFVKRAKEWINP